MYYVLTYVHNLWVYRITFDLYVSGKTYKLSNIKQIYFDMSLSPLCKLFNKIKQVLAYVSQNLVSLSILEASITS